MSTTVTFQYDKEVNTPPRLACEAGGKRQIPERDAKRLTTDGFGQVVLAKAKAPTPVSPPPETKPTAKGA